MLHNVICQLYLNKVEKQESMKEAILDVKTNICLKRRNSCARFEGKMGQFNKESHTTSYSETFVL